MSIHTTNLVEIGKFQIIEAKKWKLFWGKTSMLTYLMSTKYLLAHFKNSKT